MNQLGGQVAGSKQPQVLAVEYPGYGISPGTTDEARRQGWWWYPPETARPGVVEAGEVGAVAIMGKAS